MKILIASDIHGSAFYCKKLVEAFEREKAERLLLLGDLLYHGARNDLPGGYDTKEVTKMLNGLKDVIFCVRGNCDSEVDQMVLEFPIMAEYCLLPQKGHIVFATHGHRYNPENLPLLNKGDVLLNGHTHVPTIMPTPTVTYVNCGSVALPKGGSPHSYATLQDGLFLLKDIDGNEFKRFEM